MVFVVTPVLGCGEGIGKAAATATAMLRFGLLTLLTG